MAAAGGGGGGGGMGGGFWGELTNWIKGVKGTIIGIGQKKRAKKLRKKGEAMEREAYAMRTDYQIPEEVKNNYAQSQNEAYAKPAVQRYMEEGADRELANNISAVGQYSTSGADALSAAFAANQQSLVGKNQAAVAGAQARQQNMGRMYEAGNTLADYRSMAWDMNVNVPFLQRLQWAQDLQGAGYQGEIDATNTMI